MIALPAGFHGKRLYNLFRPEFARKYSEPLSSDAFTGFGIHDFRVHHPPVREATLHLRQVTIPEFSKMLDRHEAIPIHGIALVTLMHAHGINCRYLGVVRAHSKDQRVRHLVGTEMISRAAKTIFREHMRNCATPEELLGSVVQNLNYLLGSGECSAIFWLLFIRVVLMGKFGGYNLPIWSADEMANLSAHISKPALLSEIQQKTGIVLRPEKYAALDFSLESPFSARDVAEVTSTVKRLITPHSLMALLQEQAGHHKLHLRTLEEKLAANLQQVQLLSRIFGLHSAPVAALHLQRAHLHLTDGSLARAHLALQEVCDAAARTPALPLDLTIAVLYLAARVLEGLGRPVRAFSVYMLALSELNRLTGATHSIYAHQPLAAHPRDRNDPRHGRLQASGGHPFAMFLINRICNLLYAYRNLDLAFNISTAFFELWRHFFFPGSTRQRIELFGYAQPLPIPLYIEAAALAGASRNRSSDVVALLTPPQEAPDLGNIFGAESAALQGAAPSAAESSTEVHSWYAAAAIWENITELALSPYSSRILSSADFPDVFRADPAPEPPALPLPDVTYLSRSVALPPSERCCAPATALTDLHCTSGDAFHQSPRDLLRRWPALDLASFAHPAAQDAHAGYRIRVPYEAAIRQVSWGAAEALPLVWHRPARHASTANVAEIARLYPRIMEPRTEFVDNEYQDMAPIASFPFPTRMPNMVPFRSGVLHFQLPEGATVPSGFYLFRLYEAHPGQPRLNFLAESNLIFLYDDFDDPKTANMLYSIPTDGQAIPIPRMLSTQVLSVAAGSVFRRCFVLAATPAGVFGWGDNTVGQLGLGFSGVAPVPVPTPIKALMHQQIVSIHVANTGDGAASDMHCAALSGRGNIFTWGSGNRWQLGHGTNTSTDTPRLVQALEGKSVVQISLGAQFVAAITAAGELWYWGSCSGASPLVTPTDESVLCLKVPTRGGGSRLSQMRFVKVCAGPSELLLITEAGHVWSCGDIAAGFCFKELRAFHLLRALTPYYAVDLAIGNRVRFVLMADGTLYSWGEAESGALGNGQITPIWTMVSSDQNHVVEVANTAHLLPKLVKVVASHTHCAGIDRQGRVWRWGGDVFLPRRADHLFNVGHKFASMLSMDPNGNLFVLTRPDDRSTAGLLVSPAEDRLALHQACLTPPLSIEFTSKSGRLLTSDLIEVTWSRPLYMAARLSCIMLLEEGQETTHHRKNLPLYAAEIGTLTRDGPDAFHLSGTVEFKLPIMPGRFHLAYGVQCLLHHSSHPIILHATRTFETHKPGLADLQPEIVNPTLSPGQWLMVNLDVPDSAFHTGPILTAWFCEPDKPPVISRRQSVSVNGGKYQFEIGPFTKAGRYLLGMGSAHPPTDNENLSFFVSAPAPVTRPNDDAGIGGDATVTLTDPGTLDDGVHQSLLQRVIGGAQYLNEVVFELTPTRVTPSTPLSLRWKLPAAGCASYLDRIQLFAVDNKTGSSGVIMVAGESEGVVPIFGPYETGQYQARWTALNPENPTESGEIFCSLPITVEGAYDPAPLQNVQQEITQIMVERGKKVQIAAQKYFQEKQLRNAAASSPSTSSPTPSSSSPSSPPTPSTSTTMVGKLSAEERKAARVQRANDRMQKQADRQAGRAQKHVALMEKLADLAQKKEAIQEASLVFARDSPAVISPSTSSPSPSLPSTSSSPNPSEDAPWSVTKWLQDNGCSQFSQQFIDNGYDDLELVSALGDEDLDAMGITALGFRKKLKLIAGRLAK